METVEPVVQAGVQWLRLSVETVGALVIGLGLLTAMMRFGQALVRGQVADFAATRISFALSGPSIGISTRC